jgi:type I restriction enzyme S subunit
MIMPITFDKRRLKYVATINDESLSETTEPEYELQYIDIGNVDSYGTIHDIVSYKFANAPSRARRIVRDGDIVVSTVRTYLQAIAPIEKPPENLIVSTGFAVVRPDRQIFDARFCKYAVREKRFLWEVESRSTGVSYPAINASDLADIQIGFPDLETQRLIADYLDRETARIDALVAEKEKMLTLLEEKRSALISQAVTRGLDPDAPLKSSGLDWLGDIPVHWEVIRLKHLVSKIGSGITPKGGAESYQFEGIPFLRSQNIHFDGLRLDDIVFIDSDTHESMSNSKVLEGDVLINITGASIGRCYYIEEMQGEAKC